MTAHDIDQVFASILRGAALLLGCNSANLIVYNPKRREASVRLGVTGDQRPIVAEVETLFRAQFEGRAFPVPDTTGSLALEAILEGEIRETGSLADLVGPAFPRFLVERAAALIGEHRYIAVPVLQSGRCFGIVLFEKGGARPFSAQQRDIMLRYAERVGALMDNEVRALEQPVESPTKERSSVGHQLLHLALGETAPTITVDPALRVTSCNEATTRALGYEPSALVGEEITLLFPEAEDFRAVLDERFLAMSDGYHEEDFVVRHADGSFSRAKVKALMLVGDRGEVVGYVVLVRKTAGGEREGVARVMRQERLAMMGELAAQLAHEIRNPLLAVGASLESLAEDLSGQEGELVHLLADEVARLDLLLKDYMSLAQRYDARVGEVDLARLARSVARLLGGAKAARGKHIELDLAEGLLVSADFEGLRQVLFNLLQNALEASPAGGSVRCQSRAEPGRAVLRVEDEGHGLSAPAARCLEPFFTTKSNGSGLGLTVSQRIVAAHGGLLSLRERPGGGAVAEVVLPRKENP